MERRITGEAILSLFILCGICFVGFMAWLTIKGVNADWADHRKRLNRAVDVVASYTSDFESAEKAAFMAELTRRICWEPAEESK